MKNIEVSKEAVHKRSQKIWNDAVRNAKKLEKCEGPHDFTDVEVTSGQVFYRCTKCAGRVSAVARLWYQNGLKHGRNQQ